MPRSQDKRPQRVGQMLQQEISRLLISGLHDPRIGFVTITEVRVAGDLRHARIYISAYTEKAEREESLAGLNAAAGFIKRELGQVLRLKFVPDLEFVLDETLDGAQRLEQVLGAIDRGDAEAPDSSAQETIAVTDNRSALHDRGRALDEKRRKESEEHRGGRRKPARGKARSGRKNPKRGK